MKNKMINVSDELYEKLRQESNASDLIRDLLEAHYGTEGAMVKLDEKLSIEQKKKIQSDKEAAWTNDLIQGYIHFNGKTPSEEWLNEQIAKRKQMFTDDTTYEIK